MAKERYKIPSSLDTGYLDLEFQLQTKDGLGPSKPVNGKTILLGLGVIVGWFFIMFRTPIGAGGAFSAIGFTIIWFGLAVVLVKPDKTKKHGFELLLSMFNYFPKSRRDMQVRSYHPVTNMQVVTGIDYVDVEDGMLHFLDGTVGRVYHVVGTASILMFDQDKSMILNKVDNFYRKMPVGAEIIFDTVKEAQRTDRQVKAAVKGYKDLQVKSQGLQKLYKERHEVLKHGVGERFKSIHQYAVVKAPTEETLTNTESLILGDVENEGLMFKRAEPLTYDLVVRYVREMYGE